MEYKSNTLNRINHTEGAVVLNEFGYYQHEYVLPDHLGNTPRWHGMFIKNGAGLSLNV